MELAVDVRLAHAARDELAVLGAKIEDEDHEGAEVSTCGRADVLTC
jgi:hypothetical protein